MEVLIYQIVIAVLILVAGTFGKKSRNIVTIIICLFTLIQVFTLKLAVLQFITIFVAYVFSIGYEEKKVEEKKEEFNYYVVDKKDKEKSKSSFGGCSVFFIVVISIFSTIYIFQKKNERKKELLEIKKDTVVYKKGRKLFDQTDKHNNEKVVIEELENNDLTPVINKDDYLNDNFPNGNSQYYDAVRLRTTSFYTKYKELDESWGNWSDIIDLKTSIIIYLERNKISILSDVTYRYTDYDIIGINTVRKNVDGNDWEFECFDKDGIYCRIIHSISNSEDLMSQVRIEYSDEKKVYNVNRAN